MNNAVDVYLSGRVVLGTDANQAAAEFARLTGLDPGAALAAITSGQPQLAMQGMSADLGRAWLLRLVDIGIEANLQASSVPVNPAWGPPPGSTPAAQPVTQQTTQPGKQLEQTKRVVPMSSGAASGAGGGKLGWWIGGSVGGLVLVGLIVAALTGHLPLPGATPKEYTNSLGMEFVLIPAGTFQMGCVPGGGKCDSDEAPPHQVTISRPFYVGKHEVTQKQWQEVMGDNPSAFKGPDRPVESVSWNEVQIFIQKLNEKEGHKRYRLPTEAEWEHAARAGSTTTFSYGDDEDESRLGDYAWFSRNAGQQSHPVGQKQPNPWGLYDVHGNVWEWTQDRHGAYSDRSATDPQGPTTGDSRVIRGGSWDDSLCETARRFRSSTGGTHSYLGFRLALNPE